MASEVRLKFSKFATNLAISMRSCQSNRGREFHAEFRWKVAKFVASEVRVIRFSWFGNIPTNEFKQSEKVFSEFDIQ